MNNTFKGPDALRDFLDPERNSPTPLVELPGSLNPFRKDDVRIFAKAAFLSPLFNSKQIAALNLLIEAKASKKLDGVHTLVENSSGNMILCIAVLAKLFGISRVVGVVPRDIAPGKLEMLRLFGVDPEFSSGAPGEPSGITKAKELGKQPGWLNLGQYGNKANPSAFEKWLGPDLWKQTDGGLTVFCTGLGSTGTAIGSARYLKKRSKGIAIVGVSPLKDAVPGTRSLRRLKEVEFDWKDSLDHHVEVDTEASFKKSLDLCRLGLLGGPSSGLALAGLLLFLADQRSKSDLDRLRNADGEVVAAFMCPDSALLYLEKYSTHLSPADLR